MKEEMAADEEKALQIDEDREHKIDELILRAVKLDSARCAWWAGLHEDVQPVLKTLHYPMHKVLMRQLKHEQMDADLLYELEHGFKMVGQLPAGKVLCKKKIGGAPEWTEQ